MSDLTAPIDAVHADCQEAREWINLQVDIAIERVQRWDLDWRRYED